MCLQLLALRTIVNVETAPKKENWIAQLGHRVTHICVLLTVCDDQVRQPVLGEELTNEQRNTRQRQRRGGGEERMGKYENLSKIFTLVVAY
jgi:hypothetical protein